MPRTTQFTEFAIAYRSRTGSDYMGRPWALSGFMSVSAARKAAEVLDKIRCMDIVILSISSSEDVEPGPITWDFARSHMLPELSGQ